MTDETVNHEDRSSDITEAAHLGDERTTLLGFLQTQRDLVAWKLRDVPDDTLHSVCTPSGMTPHGVVQHLEHVERSWIRDGFGGQEDLFFAWSDADPDGEWKVAPDVRMEDLLQAYAEESALCDEVIAASSLNELAAKGDFSLRWIILHMVEETARHLGHLDLLREQADGQVGVTPESTAPTA